MADNAAYADELCAHGCERLASVQHADGRMLCQPCYMVEVGADPSTVYAMRRQDPFCPTCRVEPDEDCCWIGDPCPIHNPAEAS